uniref:DNA 3'-5' helicase n=1 Tax=Lutzomyia longipalpis TaxID=7200 RepID=A0A1B0C865_LUTLO
MNNKEIQEKLNKYKLRVKLWEKEFREKNNRIPSKYDIKEAGREIKDAYKMYYKITTSLLSNTLTDALDDEEDRVVATEEISPDISFSSASKTDQLESPSSEVPSPQEKHDLSTPDFEVSQINNKAWGSHLSKKTKGSSAVSKGGTSGKGKTSLASKLSLSMNFTKRNPRKSFSRLNSSTSDKAETPTLSSTSQIPDFETLLSQRSSQIPEIIASEADKKPQSVEKIFDLGWIERCGGKSDNCPEFDPSRISSLNSQNETISGISPVATHGKAQKIETSFAIATKVTKKADSDGSVVEDSEDESVIMSQQSVRHVLKKRRVFSSILNRQAKENENRLKAQQEVEKKVEAVTEKPKEDEKPPKTSRKKTKAQKDVKSKGNHSDSWSEKEDEVPLKLRKTSKKPAKGQGRGRPKKTPRENLPEIHEDDEYLPPLDTEFTKKPSRVGKESLTENEKLFSSYICQTLPAEQDATGDEQRASVKDAAKEKLLKKISSGKANENFVRINMKKKVFVRGKKTINYSRYKKAMWKKKKAASLLDDRGCDGEEFKCFQCGAPGHFAAKCPRNESFPTVPVTEVSEEELVEESDLQTLEDAAQSAREVEEFKDTGKVYLESEQLEDIVKDLEKADVEEIQAAVYPLDQQGNLIETPAEVREALHLFGHKSFRAGQEKAIMRILSGLSTLVTLNTGSGKSLCYQLPALIYSRHGKGMTLVISPLVSLMEDQISGIPSFLKARCLHTNQTPKMRQLVKQELLEGRVDLLLVSPEAVAYGDKKSEFGQILSSMPRIAFVCIDEAHCLSQWSHNFRPSYLMLCKILREKLKISVVLGLTATATNLTRDEIVSQIGVPDGRSGVISDIPLPENLTLTVSSDVKREDALIDLLKSPKFADKSVIIYCTRREVCESVAGRIRTVFSSEKIPTKKRKRTDWIVEAYHAGLVASRRRSIQNAFMSGQLKIVVATIAFGMGINKPDIRGVIHFNMPKNFESYVQEIGRAGRDGEAAHCHLFLDSRRRDKIELQRFIYANSIDRFTLRRLLQKIFIPCACKRDGRRESCPGHEIAFSVDTTVQTLDIAEENISTLLCYLEQDMATIQVLSKAYVRCRVFSYGGAEQLKKAAKSCPPLAMAISMKIKEGKFRSDATSIEFSAVDVAAALGWDSGVVKYQLKNLEWTKMNNQPRRTTISVQFDDIGFRIRAPGNFTDEQMDNTLEMLVNRLQSIFEGLNSVVVPTVDLVLREEMAESSEKLKRIIREYFEKTQVGKIDVTEEPDDTTDEQLERDIRYMVANYPDNNFTGRSLARIFHGISSPNFPAIVWGRCKLWRAHTMTNIHRIIALANATILEMRT